MIVKQLKVPSCELGESPVWCERTQRLYYVDILQKKLYVYETLDQSVECHDLPSLTSAVVLTDKVHLVLLISDDGVLLYDLHKKNVQENLAIYPETKGVTRSNEGAATPNGDLMFGTMPYLNATEETIGRWYVMNHADQQIKFIGKEVSIPNTLCWWENQLYFADSKKQTLYQSDVNMQNAKVFHQDEGNQVPDGSCIDAQGILWNAKWGGSSIVGYDLKHQTIVKTIELPAINPTSCCLGGQDMSTLFITSSYVDVDSHDPCQGGLYAIENFGQGRLTNRYLLKSQG